MQYRLVVVVRPEDEKTSLDRLTVLLDKEGFKVLAKSSWGKRELAYPIQKQTAGLYLEFMLEGVAKPKQLSARFKLEESVLRSLLLKKEEKGELKTQSSHSTGSGQAKLNPSVD